MDMNPNKREQEKKKTVEFFMMLTNRSILLAKYTIASYNKVFDLLHDKYDLRLIVYLNAINKNKYESDLSFILDHSRPGLLLFVEGKYSNTDFKWTGSNYQLKGTEKYYKLPMVTPAEGQDEYFQRSSADYFVTVDDDFEIIDPRFIEVMLNYMEHNDIPCISTEKSEKFYAFDRYSNAYTESQPRNCTWFCIYRVSNRLPISMCVKDSFFKDNGEVITWKGVESEISWTDYEKVFREESGKRKTWDNGGWLQEIMRENRPIVSVGDIKDFSTCYIHYAAFASNSRINSPFKTAVYRFLMIHSLRSNSFFMKKVYRKIRKQLFPDGERQVTNQRSSLD